jgi:serine/threonine protein kinase
VVTAGPKKVGNYTLGERIGTGGQGVVYRSVRGEAGEPVAVKLLKLTRPKKRARFIQEIKIHAALSGNRAANIMPLLDHNLTETENGEVQGYLVMPLAKSSLDDVKDILHGRLELSLEIFCGIVDGVRAAHAGGVIHRDLKPANVLFLDAALREPLVSDFGICLLRETPDADRITEVGETVGAKFFMAPEQEHGGVSDVTPSADVYALGKLLHFMLTGRYIHRERLADAFTAEEMNGEPRLQIVADEILRKTIIEDPSQRVRDAQELHRICQEVLIRVKSGGSRFGGATPAAAGEATEALQQEYKLFQKVFTSENTKRASLLFDGLFEAFDKSWQKLHGEIQTEPGKAATAVASLIREHRTLLSAALALARTDATNLYQSFKGLLEQITELSEGVEGYAAVSSVPQPVAGFLYMSSSLFALHHESWGTFQKHLTGKYRWVYQSGRPHYDYGFDHPDFFHSEALEQSGPKHHDLYRELLLDPEVVVVTRLEKERLYETYAQAQFLMSLRAAQLSERGETVRLWADFGRFYAERISILLDRIYSEPDYSAGLLAAFGESREEFFAKLNDRLRYIQRNYFGGGRYIYSSLSQWTPQ